MQLTSSNHILALDVGEKRIGVAVANVAARIPHPLTTINNDGGVMEVIDELIKKYDVVILVLGLPRNLQGDYTAQTATVEAFGARLEAAVALSVQWQDEALTSRKAEDELRSRGKPYEKGDIDALAATFILDDFLGDHPEVKA